MPIAENATLAVLRRISKGGFIDFDRERAIAASYVEKLLNGTCGWMATYVDMDDGCFQCVPADQRHVAQIAVLHTNTVVNRTIAPPPDSQLSA